MELGGGFVRVFRERERRGRDEVRLSREKTERKGRESERERRGREMK